MKYLNILVIEDETPLAEMHAEFIKRHSLCRQIWLAGNLEQGRMMIANFKPDLIVLDNYLPDGRIELLQSFPPQSIKGRLSLSPPPAILKLSPMQFATAYSTIYSSRFPTIDWSKLLSV